VSRVVLHHKKRCISDTLDLTVHDRVLEPSMGDGAFPASFPAA
jgi:hypothetical protein